MKKMPFNIRMDKLMYKIGDLFLYLFIILTAYIMVFDNASILLRIRFVVLLVGALFGLLGTLRKFNLKILFFIFLILLSYIMIILVGRDGIYSSDLFLYTMGYIGLGLNLINHKQGLYLPTVIYYVGIFTIIIRILIFQIPIRQFMQDGSSHNYISVLALFFLCIYGIALEQNEKKIPLNVAILFVFVTILAYGRGGILTGFVFLFLVVMPKIKEIKKIIVRWAVVLLLLFAMIIFLDSNLYNLAMDTIFKKFSLAGTIDEARLSIWGNFLKSTHEGIGTFLWGASPYGSRLDGNLHNTFLQGYASFGIFVFTVFIVAYIALIIYAIKKRKYTLLAIVVTFIVRASTDKIAFQGFCEMYLFYFVFYAMQEIYIDKRNDIYIVTRKKRI